MKRSAVSKIDGDKQSRNDDEPKSSDEKPSEPSLKKEKRGSLHIFSSMALILD